MPTDRFPGIGKIRGKMAFNFFEKANIVATDFGSESVSGEQPDMIITFNTSGVLFLNEGSGVVEYSFNGYDIYGELDSEKPTAGLAFDNRYISKIWFRIKPGSTGPITVSVHAW